MRNMSIEKSVLLIGDTKSFMVSAVAKGIKEEGFRVIQVMPSVDEINRLTEIPVIWVFYLDDKIGEQTDLFVFLKDEIIERKVYFFPVGNPDEIAEATERISAPLIRESFSRPLNVPVMVAALEKAYAEESKIAERKQILIIDDNPMTLRSLQSQLEEKYRVYIASSGVNGITFLTRHPVDLILLDYEMPVADGPMVMEMMKQESNLASIPIMFLTGKSDKESVMKAVALKPVKYLLKSMPPQELLGEIDAFFAS